MCRVSVEEARAAACDVPIRKRRRTRPGVGRVMRHHCYRVILLGALACLGGLMFMGQTIIAPDWVRAGLATRIERELDGFEIAFGDVHFIMRKGWRPRVGLRDLEITDRDGRPVLELSSAEATLAMRPLLKGKVTPKTITLDGARATFRRAQDGTVALDFGGRGQVVEEAETLPDLIEGWEDKLLRDPLQALVRFELTALTLRYEDARSGHSWTVDDGRFSLERHGDRLSLASGFALLSGRSYAASLEASYTSSIRSRAAQFGIQITDMAAEDIAAQTAALGWLDPLRAPISGAMRGGLNEDGAILPLSVTLRIGEGVLQPTDATTPIPFDGAQAYVTFDPADQALTFDALTVDSGWGSGTAEGRALITRGDHGGLDMLVGQFNVGALTLNPAEVYTEPLHLSGAHAEFRLRLDPFELTLGEALILDGDNPLRLNGMLAAKPEGWHYALDGRIETIDATRLLEIWPRAAAVKPRIWVSENVAAGRLTDLDWAIRGTPDDAAPDIYADFAFDGAEIRFAKHLPPLTDTRGEASFVGHRLAATITQGEVRADEGGALDVTGSSFIVPDVRVKPGTPAIVRARATGSPTAVLSLLNRPPLAILKSSDLPVDMAQGQVTAEGTLALPMQKGITLADMDYHAHGTLTDVHSAVLVPGHTLKGQDLTLDLDPTQVSISGRGTLSDVPADFTWRQPLGQPGVGSRVEAVVDLSPQAIETFKIGLPDDMVRGQGQADVVVDLPPGETPKLTLGSDLDGLTLSVPSLGWRKGPGTRGRLDLTATLGAQPRVDQLTLTGAGLSLAGRVTTKSDGSFDRAIFDRVSLGGWMTGQVELRGRGTGLAPLVRVLGGTLDLGQAQFGAGSGGDAPPLDVTLDRLQIADGLALTNLRGAFQTRGGLQGDFTGQMNGGTALSGTVLPESGRTAVRITSQDAGGVFRDAGIVKQAYGGDLQLILRPVSGTEGSYDGTLKVTRTHVRESTGLGAVLNAISLVGLIDELSGNGLAFSEVDAEFRLSPKQLTLLSASAVGNSIGLSLDGVYDLASATLDMQGVLSPLYALNAIGSVMTRKGEGLIGFNFRLRGPASDPSVTVNPLSALAPGFLREIFRDPSPTVTRDRTDGATAPTSTRRGPISGEDR